MRAQQSTEILEGTDIMAPLCGNEFKGNYDPETSWTGSVFCTLHPHEKGTTHIGFLPSGKVREWRDVQGISWSY